MPLVRHLPDRLEGRVLFAAYVAGSATAYATIQAAVNAAPSGGTVTVTAGTYAEQVTISKPLTVEGAQTGVDARSGSRPTGTASTESVVTGALSGSTYSSAFHVLASNVTVDGFTVAGETSQDDALGAGIVIGPTEAGTHVTDDVIRGNVSGLFLANDSTTDAALIQHDYFASNNNAGDNGGRGIYTDGTLTNADLTNVTIDSNTFYNNHGGSGTTGYEAAIALEAGNPNEQSNIRVTNNLFNDNGKAVLCFNVNNMLIQGNTVTNTQDHWSGSLRFEGGDTNVTIDYNTADANTGPAVAVDSKGVPYDDSGFVVNYNNFYDNNDYYSTHISVGVDFDNYDGAFDARYNYWGSSSGPSGYGTGTGDAVGGGAYNPSNGWALSPGGDVLFSPWATANVTAPTGTVPAAPTSLAATATSSTAASLRWTDNAAGNESGFTVQRSSNGGSTYTQVGTTLTGITTYADSGLTAGTTYDYRVYAVNSVGTSAASNVAAITTAAAAVPTAPGNLTTTAASSTTVALAWTAATGQSAYAVDRSTNGGTSWTTVATPASSATSYADTGLSAGTTYAYRVRATNGAGTSAASNTATAVTLSAGTTVGLTTLTPTSATVGWGTLGINVTIKGNPITLRGAVYPTGLGAHASSTITYALAGKYASFTCAVGVDDEVNGLGAVDFQVLGDGKLLYDSGVVTGASAVAHLAVSVANVQTLTLQASPGVAGTIDYDHADWASPVLTLATTAQAAAVTQRTGTAIGTAGATGTSTAQAVDGNLSTYYNATAASGNWVGLDLGSAKAVSQISFAPRSGYASRMVGGVFQASTTATFTTVTTLYTVTAAPTNGVLTTVTVASPVTDRYFRYLSPANSYGDVAEIAFAG